MTTTLQAAQAGPTAAPWRPRIFVSYARYDAQAVDALVQGMRQLQYPVWVDQNLTAGTSWWGVILQQIRDCDVVIVAVSKALLESEAAHAEQTYAQALGKPVLPVMIGRVESGALPPHLARIQFVDYTDPSPMAGFALASALSAVHPSPPLPPTLPPEPPPPGLYQLAEQIQKPNLTLEEQLSVVTSLKVLLGRPRERSIGVELAQRMAQRQDRYYIVVQEMDKLDLDEQTPSPTGPATGSSGPPPTTGAVPPAGWYPDPSGRHQMRWFDEDWTAYVADGGAMSEDPNF